jgi:hypothetical protein
LALICNNTLTLSGLHRGWIEVETNAGSGNRKETMEEQKMRLEPIEKSKGLMMSIAFWMTRRQISWL